MISTWLLPIQLIAFVLAKEATIIGVDPSRLHEYQNENLVCPKTGVKLTPEMINDGYCDCPDDGFDEPGTAACTKAKFYCANKPFKAQYISSSRVNDGVCDCCDGSDEYLNLFGTPCPNTCEEERKAIMRAKYIRHALNRKAVKIAQKMKVAADAKRQELQNELTELHGKIAELKQQAESLPNDIRENPEAFEEYIQEYNAKIKELEDLISASKYSNEPLTFTTSAEQKQADKKPWSVSIGEKISRIKSMIKGFNRVEENHTTTITKYIPTIVTQTIVKFEPSVSLEMRLNELEWERRDLEARAESLHKELNVDSYFGPDSIYLVYKDKCYSYDSASGHYTFCWFKDITQSSPGSFNNLGSWKGWHQHSNGTVDFHKIHFGNGHRCGGKSREATVELVCGYNEEIISASEPQTCKHLLKFSSPAACIY